MSGHSKWQTIKKQKESTDQQRGKTFSKLTRGITIAAKDSIDPESNFKLRLLIEKARQANMPKENIERAIKKGSGGEGGEKWEEITYEGYGPDGIGIIVEVVTDNKNRTTAEIKNIFERGGGSITSPGAVSFQFKKSGLITVEKSGKVDEQILKIIDLGAEEVQEVTDAIEVSILPNQLKEVKEKIEQAGFKVKEAELIMQPNSPLKIGTAGDAQKILKFMSLLEDRDDVQKVYGNFDIPDEYLTDV